MAAVCFSALAETLPNLDTNRLALWLRADAGVITNRNGNVEEWLDQSGHGNNAVQTELDAMPEWVGNFTAGQPAVRFAGLGDFLEIPHAPSLEVKECLSIFAVLRVENLFDYTNGIIAKTTNNLPAPFDFYLQPGGQPRLFTGNGNGYDFVWGNSNVSTDRPILLAAVVDGTNGMTYLDGVYNGRSMLETTMYDLGGSVRIGTRADFKHWLKGEIAELLLIRGAVSVGERKAIHDYLGRKYNLNVVLDVTLGEHPNVGRIEGQTATFSANAVSSDPIVRFQWEKNGLAIPDATNAVYTTPTLTLADHNANFRVRVSSAGTNRYSGFISVNILPDTAPLTITTAAFLLRDQTQTSTNGTDRRILPPYSSRFWQTSEDPARGVVQAIAQTTDGFLWIGTEAGLARFDGQQFQFVPLGSKGASTRQRINALAPGTNGALWVGTVEDGLLELRDNTWVSHPLPPGVDPAILTFQPTRNELWLGTRVGLAVLKNDKLTLLPDWLASADVMIPFVAARTVRTLAEDHQGNIWVGLSESLIRLQEGRPPKIVDVSPFPLFFVRALLCTRDGSTWIGANSGLIRIKDGEVSHFSKIDGLPDNVVTALYEDRRGNIWIGTSGGLCRFAEGRFVVEMTDDGQLYNQIFCFYEDRENNLWVGSKNGLYQLTVQQFTTYTTRHGLAHNNVISVYEDRSGAIWIGTWGGGLHCLRDGKITIYSSDRNKVMRNDLILAIHGTDDGGIWFGEDYDGGVYRLKNGEINRYAWEPGKHPGPVRTLLETSGGQLLLGTTMQSLNLLQGQRIVPFREGDLLSSRPIRCLLETKDGRIWIGTEAGLCVKGENPIEIFTTADGLSDNRVLSLYEDAEQMLWIGTAKGLDRLDHTQGKRVLSFTTKSDLFDDPVLEILEDEEDHLWIASRRGVFRINKNELEDVASSKTNKIRYSAFGKADGMYSPVCVGVAKPSAYKSRDGRLWFATTKGLAVTDPKLRIEKNEILPPVVISQVIADKKVIDPSQVLNKTFGIRMSAPDASRNSIEAVDIMPGRGEVEIHYLALSYAAPENNRFKYKLEGADLEWVDAGTRRVAYYNNLAPGTYLFRVIACNNDGVWNETGASLKLRLSPHFWQTGWFLGGMGFAAVGLVGGFARFFTKRNFQRKLERLERQHAIERERTRIAGDLHDQLGASLTRVYVLNELAARDSTKPDVVQVHTKKSSETLRAISKTLHEIVWAVNPQNDTLRRLAAFIAHYTEEFFESTPVRCRLDIPAELPDTSLSAEMRHNVFLVVKEALNNIAKHANATEVRVEFVADRERMKIVVADNGQGFSPSEVDVLRNGLQNMKRRMDEIGGHCELRSMPGEGTSITLTLSRRRRDE